MMIRHDRNVVAFPAAGSIVIKQFFYNFYVKARWLGAAGEFRSFGCRRASNGRHVSSYLRRLQGYGNEPKLYILNIERVDAQSTTCFILANEGLVEVVNSDPVDAGSHMMLITVQKY